jgi:hypothetical protein
MAINHLHSSSDVRHRHVWHNTESKSAVFGLQRVHDFGETFWTLHSCLFRKNIGFASGHKFGSVVIDTRRVKL